MIDRKARVIICIFAESWSLRFKSILTIIFYCRIKEKGESKVPLELNQYPS